MKPNDTQSKKKHSTRKAAAATTTIKIRFVRKVRRYTFGFGDLCKYFLSVSIRIVFLCVYCVVDIKWDKRGREKSTSKHSNGMKVNEKDNSSKLRSSLYLYRPKISFPVLPHCVFVFVPKTTYTRGKRRRRSWKQKIVIYKLFSNGQQIQNHFDSVHCARRIIQLVFLAMCACEWVGLGLVAGEIYLEPFFHQNPNGFGNRHAQQ